MMNDVTLMYKTAYVMSVRAINADVSLTFYTVWANAVNYNPVSILRKSISDRHRPVRVADRPMTARCRFT